MSEVLEEKGSSRHLGFNGLWNVRKSRLIWFTHGNVQVFLNISLHWRQLKWIVIEYDAQKSLLRSSLRFILCRATYLVWLTSHTLRLMKLRSAAKILLSTRKDSEPRKVHWSLLSKMIASDVFNVTHNELSYTQHLVVLAIWSPNSVDALLSSSL